MSFWHKYVTTFHGFDHGIFSRKVIDINLTVPRVGVVQGLALYGYVLFFPAKNSQRTLQVPRTLMQESTAHSCVQTRCARKLCRGILTAHAPLLFRKPFGLRPAK
jgi:hypothetical protein